MSNNKLQRLKILCNRLEKLLDLEDRYKHLSNELNQATLKIQVGFGINSTFIDDVDIIDSKPAQIFITKRLVQIGQEIIEIENLIKTI